MYPIGISFRQTRTAMHKLRSLRSSARVYALLLLSQTNIVNKVRPLSTTKYSPMQYRYLDKRLIPYVNSDKFFCFSLSKNVRKLEKLDATSNVFLGLLNYAIAWKWENVDESMTIGRRLRGDDTHSSRFNV